MSHGGIAPAGEPVGYARAYELGQGAVTLLPGRAARLNQGPGCGVSVRSTPAAATCRVSTIVVAHPNSPRRSQQRRGQNRRLE